MRAASPKTSHWHEAPARPAWVTAVYSGKFKAKRLTNVPVASYSSTADVRRSRASAVCFQTKNALAELGGEHPRGAR